MRYSEVHRVYTRPALLSNFPAMRNLCLEMIERLIEFKHYGVFFWGGGFAFKFTVSLHMYFSE